MATTQTINEPATSAAGAPSLLVSLASLSHDAFEHLLTNLGAAFPGEAVVVATPDNAVGGDAEANHGGLRVVGYTPSAPSPGSWTLTAADFLNAHELAARYQAPAVLVLGTEAQSLAPSALRGLADSVVSNGCDLAMARYTLPPRAGLVNSAILYPVTRALFAARPRFPLAIDMALSARMAERLATAAQRFTAAGQTDAMVWPISEAAVAGFSIAQVEVGTRTLPAPQGVDLNSVLAQVAGSLFSDVDAKASFWQRARPVQTERIPVIPAATPTGSDEVQGMLDTFRLAYTNLHEIWSLVLPPQSLLGLKRLSVMQPAEFRMSDSLWARIVYDFLLAYRLRTINRGHLLGALTPLYLAWAASHILMTEAGTDPERHIEAVAAAFEADKPYLVSRWRWPDRFNP
ncbi:hypothetical protein [Granulicella tundricola]|uniref:Uncharacterized protein n=1 Tax=Granulicella tundricola (strain ATCC BAA-1859 / DSM 23138 / MP5ACTX9) TaxID=1198114 RepID=E8WYZ3_GRATM|nr:hypothetical protein [Granulicella tundricola]ADW69908.1 hypothetical protein AciX9_2885 [Granulicella tundricola MP5ACTX9]